MEGDGRVGADGRARRPRPSRRRRPTARRPRARASPAAFMRSMSAPRPARGSPVKPVPNSASTITSGSPSSSRRPSRRRRAPPSPHARARARRCARRRRSSRRRRRPSSGARPDGARARRAATWPPARSISSATVRDSPDSASRRRASRPPCRAARSSDIDDARPPAASSRECVIERSTSPAPTCAAHAATRPDRRTPGFGRPTISISCHAKRARRRSRAPSRPPPSRRSGPRSSAAGFGRESQ